MSQRGATTARFAGDVAGVLERHLSSALMGRNGVHALRRRSRSKALGAGTESSASAIAVAQASGPAFVVSIAMSASPGA